MEQIYHILIKKECNHNCPLCCNRLYDIDKLPTITVEQLQTADVVCLTGGEPFLLGQRNLINLCKNIRNQFSNIKRLYIYTSGDNAQNILYTNWMELYRWVDGINFSPKNSIEWKTLQKLLRDTLFFLPSSTRPSKSNRIYVFQDQINNSKIFLKGIFIPPEWEIIGRKWDKEFKTPENEHFVRLPILF